MKIILNALLLWLLMQCALAADTTVPDANTPTVLPQGALTCPAATALKRDPSNLKWYAGKTYANTDFKSYDTSFATKISGFLGAQWQGVKVGNIQCVYKPVTANTFPVVIDFGVLTAEPSASAWGNNKNGYRNCLSENPQDCYFVPLRKSPQQNPYQQLEELKKGS